MSDLVKVTVRRNKWLRGENYDVTRLLRPSDGKMCCLGFACLALGETEDSILDVSHPVTVSERHQRSVGNLTSFINNDWEHPKPVDEAMRINDLKDLDDKERETEITKLLAQVGLDMEFVDE